MTRPFSWSLAVGCLTLCTAVSRPAPALQIPEALASTFKTDFAVPDAPAFLLLDVEPSTISRPTTVRELAGTVADFASGDNLALPHALAIEFAPALLVGGKSLKLDKYQKNPALYRLRLSAATRRPEDSGSPTQIAVGLRIALIDEADLRTNSSYIESATTIATAINEIYDNARDRVGPPPTPIELTSAEEDSVAALQQPLIEIWENKKWNATVLELALGMVAQGQDSLGRDLRSSQLAAWATFGRGFGSWGQLLLGGKIASVRDSVTEDFGAKGDLAGRFYVGTNHYKFFAEVGGNWEPGTDKWLLNGGGEARLIRGGWVSFSAGLASTSDRTDLRTSLAIKLGSLGL